MNGLSTNQLLLNTGLVTLTGDHIYVNSYQILNSGDVSSLYATISNLQSTGSTLDNKINSLSGNNYYLGSNPSGFINTLSGLSTGYIQNISGVLSNRLELTGNNIPQIKVTGSNNIFSINITGDGSITVTLLNNTLSISGSSSTSSSFDYFAPVYFL